MVFSWTEKRKPIRYSDINEAADLIQDQSDDEVSVHSPPKVRLLPMVAWTVAIILVCSNVAVWWITRQYHSREEKLSGYLKGIDRNWHVVRDNPLEMFNAFTALPEGSGGNIDERWWDLGTYAPRLIVPEKYAADFGFDKAKHTFVTFEEEPHIPHEGFPATFQMQHLLHCIDFLRQGLYFNADHYRKIHAAAWNGSEGHEERLQMHLLHCVDTLRLSTLCAADVRPFPFLLETNGVFRDFRLPHQCRNWASVRDFSEDLRNGFGDAGKVKLDDHHTKEMEGVKRWSADRLWRGRPL